MGTRAGLELGVGSGAGNNKLEHEEEYYLISGH